MASRWSKVSFSSFTTYHFWLDFVLYKWHLPSKCGICEIRVQRFAIRRSLNWFDLFLHSDGIKSTQISISAWICRNIRKSLCYNSYSVMPFCIDFAHMFWYWPFLLPTLTVLRYIYMCSLSRFDVELVAREVHTAWGRVIQKVVSLRIIFDFRFLLVQSPSVLVCIEWSVVKPGCCFPWCNSAWNITNFIHYLCILTFKIALLRFWCSIQRLNWFRNGI